MSEFPLTANGKLDRRALPEPAVETGPVTAAANDDERVICETVASVLRVERVGADQDFFELGGDSILAISLLSALRAEGVYVTATQIFVNRTPRALAAVASRDGAATVDHDDVPTGPVAGLPIVQWLGETTDAIDGFVQSVVVNTPASLTASALSQILTAVVERHDMLRAKLVRGPRWSFDIPESGPALWEESNAPLEECVAAATEGLNPDAGVMLRAVWRSERAAARDRHPPRGDRRCLVAHPVRRPRPGVAAAFVRCRDRTAAGRHVVPPLDAAAGAGRVRGGSRLLPTPAAGNRRAARPSPSHR